MSVKLKSEELSLKEVICSKYSPTTAESDLIVPDLKPDIGKILQVCARGVITQKTAQQDKAYIQGVVHVTVVYIPEDGGINSIFTDLDFSHIIEAKGAVAGNHIWAESEIESIDYSIVNSRKINLKINLGLDAKICRSSQASLPVGFEESCDIQAKYKDYSLSCTSLEEEKDFSFREKLEVPSGKPDICEIIKFSGKISSCDINYSDGKINLSGDISLSVLYTDEDGGLCTIEETLPFNETLDGISLPKGECDGTFTVKDTNFEISSTPEGQCRIIDVNILIGCCFKTVKSVSMSAIADAFGTKTPVKLIKNTYEIENVADKTTAQIAHRETVLVPDYLPEIYKVCDLSGEARVTGISIDDGRIEIDGEILSNIIYISANEDSPLSGFGHITSFSHSMDMPCAETDSICEAKVELDHIGYSISSDKSLELRFIVILTLTVLKSDRLEIIEGIESCEDTAPEILSPVIIYFPEEGETVWDIAKRYMATPEDIIKGNNLESEKLHKGQKICIFR